MTPKIIDVTRKTQDVFDILSEFGGFLKILQSSFNLMTYPIAQFSLLLMMIKRMFFAKTAEENIFVNEDSKDSKYVKKRRSHYLDF